MNQKSVAGVCVDDVDALVGELIERQSLGQALLQHGGHLEIERSSSASRRVASYRIVSHGKH